MKNKLNKELAVCGFAAVKALEKKHPGKIKRFYFSKDKAPLFGGLCKKLAIQKIPYNQVETDELEKLCGSVHHQGVVAMIEQPIIHEITKDDVLNILHAKENAVLLEKVGNANNLGAIIRSAAFFGINNIIILKDDEQSSITTSSYRVAQGAMEYVKIFSVNSATDFLAELKGKMLRFGTDTKAKTTVNKMSELCRTAKKGALIILGNEENGISNQVKQKCDYLVSIPSAIELDTFDSLNVAQASSIIFYALTQQ